MATGELASLARLTGNDDVHKLPLADLPQLPIPEDELDGCKERFQKVFGTDVTEDGIAKAIAAFERTVLSGNSPYDKFMAGDEDALTEAQKRERTGSEGSGRVGCRVAGKPKR